MSAPSSNSIIDIRHLWGGFDSIVIHQDLSFSIEPGEIVSIAGGSGAGKTLLLRQMLGLEKPMQGIVRLFGENIHDVRPDVLQQLRRRSGVLFQHGALYSALNVFDNVAQPLRELRVLPQTLIRDTVLLKLQMVGLGPEHAQKMPADLSGGMIKRVALARALVLEPELLFLDEPTAGLDPDRSDSFVELIQSLHRKLRLTVVMVTHDLDTLLALSTRVAVLADKKIIASGPISDVLKIRHPFIRQFFLGARGKRALQVLHDH